MKPGKIFLSVILAAATLQLQAKDYNASMFGAKSNGTTMNTSSIQKGIDYISENGGGRLVFYVRRPEEYRQVLALMVSEGLSLDAAEHRVFGFGHADVGAALLEAWGLPERLYLPVRHQMTPASAPAFNREVAVIHLACRLSCSITPCLKTGDEPKPFVPDETALECMQLLGLTPAALAEISLDAMAASLEVNEIIQPATAVTY